jgi:hypothetical protein
LRIKVLLTRSLFRDEALPRGNRRPIKRAIAVAIFVSAHITLQSKEHQ